MKKRTILALLVVLFIVVLIWAMINWQEPSKFTSGVLIGSLPAAIAFGFIAGLILNVMPCVLPVVGLKVYFCFGLMHTPSVAARMSENGTANTSPVQWQPFQRSKLDAYLALGDTVIVNWTADWCLTCKVVEQVVLQTDEVQSAIETSKAVMLQADLTKDNPEAYALMDELGHAAHSIPFLVVFPAGKPEDPQILRDLFTKDDFLSIVNQL